MYRQYRCHAPGAGMLPSGLGAIGHHRCGRSRGRNCHPSLPAGYRPGLERQRLWWCAWRTDVPKIVDWYMEGKINIDDLITHHLKLEDINEGFEMMKSGESIRSVVMYD